MELSTRGLPSVGLCLRSSRLEIDAELRRIGVLRYPHQYLKDREFERYVLPARLKTLEDVHQFLDSLDSDNKKAFSPSGCSKAYVARQWLKYDHSFEIEPLTWALIGVARARRTCCGCHETGSFHQNK